MPPPTPAQIQIIKGTIPLLAQHATTLTTKFYTNLFTAHPSLKNLFNKTHQETGHQPRALARALCAYAAGIEDLASLGPALETICHKHASLFVRAEQYSVVGEILLQTMEAVLGGAATDEVLDAWGAAYWQLADLMVRKEEALYASAKGWDGWKEFRIMRKVREGGDIVSFYLAPVGDGVRVPAFKPGQYVSVNIMIEELDGGIWQARQYSLSDAPGKDYLRISVKKEKGIVVGEPRQTTHEGYVSSILHEKREEGDVVNVSHPFGDFFFDDSKIDEDAPVVLISTGVGLTCLTSILNWLGAKKSSRPIYWIHGARDASTRAFKKDVDALAAENKNVHAIYFSSNPKEGEIQGQDYDIKGRLDIDMISGHGLFTNSHKTQYFICGPTQFMLDVRAKVESCGVPAENVHMELFGTGGVPQV